MFLSQTEVLELPEVRGGAAVCLPSRHPLDFEDERITRLVDADDEWIDRWQVCFEEDRPRAGLVGWLDRRAGGSHDGQFRKRKSILELLQLYARSRCVVTHSEPSPREEAKRLAFSSRHERLAPPEIRLAGSHIQCR